MPKGEPSRATVATEKYQKKAGYKVKGFKLKGDVAERFAEVCNKIGKSQATVICDLMEKFINEIQ